MDSNALGYISNVAHAFLLQLAQLDSMHYFLYNLGLSSLSSHNKA